MARLSHAQILDLQQYAEPYTKEQIIEAAFQFHRKTGFPYRKLPIHVCLQEVNALARARGKALLHTNTAYHVADTYHPHRWQGHADGKISPYAAFMDDRRLRRALTLSIEGGATVSEDYFGTLSLVLGTQQCSNFRPGFAAYLYRKFCKSDSVVLDPSTGYGGRLVGAIASRVVRQYVGIDPSVKTYEGNKRLAADLATGMAVGLINKPAEDCRPAEIRKLAPDGIDFAFSSFPYFGKEHYSDEPTQSRIRYPEAKSWYLGFLVPTMALVYEVLKPGAKCVINIADINLRGARYPLTKWCLKAAASVNFDHVDTLTFKMASRYGANQEEGVATEPVFVFERPRDA